MKARIVLSVLFMGLVMAVNAKNIKTVIIKSPDMHCANCEKKVQDNIRFEKGVKEIKTNVPNRTITIKYDADKTTVDNLMKGFAKIKYRASVCDDTTGATVPVNDPKQKKE